MQSRYSEYKANLRLALPVALSQLGYVIVQFADNAMTGAYGGNDPLPLSAVSFGVMVKDLSNLLHSLRGHTLGCKSEVFGGHVYTSSLI